MLYHARDTRVLKAGYQMKWVSVRQPRPDVKYVPVYRSPTGDEVFENEATVEGIEIVEVRGTEPSRNERERAIEELTGILCRSPLPNVDRRQVEHAIEAMALESDLKLKAGQQLAKDVPKKVNDDGKPHSGRLAARLLAESEHKEAIVPLTKWLVCGSPWDHHMDEDVVLDLALTTLRKFVADSDAFRYEAAGEALALLANQGEPFYKNLVRTWAIELLVGLAFEGCTHRSWAREHLHELVGTNVI